MLWQRVETYIKVQLRVGAVKRLSPPENIQNGGCSGACVNASRKRTTWREHCFELLCDCDCVVVVTCFWLSQTCWDDFKFFLI